MATAAEIIAKNQDGKQIPPPNYSFCSFPPWKIPISLSRVARSGALILSSERVLRDYKNYFKSRVGTSKENVESLRVKTSSFTPVQRYIAVVMDEMKIQSNLVFDKVSGDLVGFINLGDPMTNFANLTDEDPIAIHALAFLVRGLCTDLKHIIANFFTGKCYIIPANASLLENCCSLKIFLNYHGLFSSSLIHRIL